MGLVWTAVDVDGLLEIGEGPESGVLIAVTKGLVLRGCSFTLFIPFGQFLGLELRPFSSKHVLRDGGVHKPLLVHHVEGSDNIELTL